MNYDSFTYIYPPRAENAIPPFLLKAKENKGWIAQIKKNGINSVIFVSPDKDVFAMNRHAEKHALWEFPAEAKRIFQSLPGKGWYVLNAELLHAKVPGIRNINYVHDILVEDGQYLLGTTYAERYSKLLMHFLKGQEKFTDGYYILNEYTWLARNFRSNFLELFKSLSAPEDEGIVLKKLDGRLDTRNNNSWTVKCRRAHKNFEF